MKVSEGPIIIEQEFSCKKEILWKAITELEQMREWFFSQIESFEARIGFRCSFNVYSEGILFVHQWRLIELEELKSYTLEWNYAEIVGNSEVRFEIQEFLGGTRLVVHHKVLRDFISDLTQFERKSCEAGWNYLIKESLVKHLNQFMK